MYLINSSHGYLWLDYIQLPEGAEVLTVQLLPVDGPGLLATTNTQTQLTIAANDDPVNFRGSFVDGVEGNTVQLTLERGGQAIGREGTHTTVFISHCAFSNNYYCKFSEFGLCVVVTMNKISSYNLAKKLNFKSCI